MTAGRQAARTRAAAAQDMAVADFGANQKTSSQINKSPRLCPRRARCRLPADFVKSGQQCVGAEGEFAAGSRKLHGVKRLAGPVILEVNAPVFISVQRRAPALLKHSVSLSSGAGLSPAGNLARQSAGDKGCATDVRTTAASFSTQGWPSGLQSWRASPRRSIAQNPQSAG